MDGWHCDVTLRTNIEFGWRNLVYGPKFECMTSWSQSKVIPTHPCHLVDIYTSITSSFKIHIEYHTLHKVQLILLEFIAKKYDFCFNGNLLEKQPLGKPWRRRDNNIKFDFGEIGNEDASWARTRHSCTWAQCTFAQNTVNTCHKHLKGLSSPWTYHCQGQSCSHESVTAGDRGILWTFKLVTV